MPVPLTTLAGAVVTRWRGIETALSWDESEGLSNVLWYDEQVPYLQLGRLDVQLSTGEAYAIHAQYEDGTGFHGLYVFERLPLPSAGTFESSPESVDRERDLLELPIGEIAISRLRRDGPNAIIEAVLSIAGSELCIRAAEVYEEGDGILVIREPDESILVQVNGSRPNTSLERTRER
jgi:hypothetical protein